jgi:hypothetical protein
MFIRDIRCSSNLGCSLTLLTRWLLRLPHSTPYHMVPESKVEPSEGKGERALIHTQQSPGAARTPHMPSLSQAPAPFVSADESLCRASSGAAPPAVPMPLPCLTLSPNTTGREHDETVIRLDSIPSTRCCAFIIDQGGGENIFRKGRGVCSRRLIWAMASLRSHASNNGDG